ncbi:MAG: methyltransferase [Bdellovibrionales bacterium]|nr:methyltransferase [Bdellovibrionales bacterium]
MSLILIATPIGNPSDISLRALEELKAAEVIFGEEFAPLTRLLKHHGIPKPRLELLNEHSSQEQIQDLFELVKTLRCALISDAGTPGFCDPGYQLVRLCRDNGVPITSAPGASSLMCLLALAGHRLEQFYFRGFLPRENIERQKDVRSLLAMKVPVVVMDTPYRLKKTLTDFYEAAPERHAVLGMGFTEPTERVLEGSFRVIHREIQDGTKAEFLLLVFPSTSRTPD